MSKTATSAGPQAAKASATFAPAPAGPSRIADRQSVRHLQRSFGNSCIGGLIQRKCACGGTCDDCRKKDVRRKGEGSMSELPDGFETLLACSGAGTPLDNDTQHFMESRMRHDFSDVRVHTDTPAATAARQIHAQAFTAGRDIYFAVGRYQPSTLDGKRLIAHELSHVVQQRSAAPVNRWAKSELGLPGDALEREADQIASLIVDGSGLGQSAISDARVPMIRRQSERVLWERAKAAQQEVVEAVEAVEQFAGDVGEGIAEAGETVYEAGVEVVEAGAVAIDWLATEAGNLARRFASSLGGIISITPAGLQITVPRVCPIGAIVLTPDLPTFEREFMVPIGALPLGPLMIIGEVGVVGRLQPRVQLQLGPFCLNGVQILINPFTGTYDFSAGLSATTAVSLGAEIRGGLRGALNLETVVVIGGIPVPISVPLAGLEGGLAGLLQGIGARTVSIDLGHSTRGGRISINERRQVDLGLAADLFLGAYGQLDIGGENVCRIYWQPYAWHGAIAGSAAVAVGVTIVPGLPPSIVPNMSPPTFESIPFEQIPLALSRGGFSDDCPILDRICDVLRLLNLLPSQRGGSWNWSGPYGPGPRLAGPLEVYQKNPGIRSGSECRGACGSSCEICVSIPIYHYTDPATGETWEYTNFQDCNSHEGCREHDAAFDWAAAVHGETGRWAIILPWHMAANIECTCNNLAGNCLAWIAGLPPYDRKMYFADTATSIGHLPPTPTLPPGAPGIQGTPPVPRLAGGGFCDNPINEDAIITINGRRRNVKLQDTKHTQMARIDLPSMEFLRDTDCSSQPHEPCELEFCQQLHTPDMVNYGSQIDLDTRRDMDRYKDLVKKGLEATPEPSSGEWEGEGEDTAPVGFNLLSRAPSNKYRVHAQKQGNLLTDVHLFPD